MSLSTNPSQRRGVIPEPAPLLFCVVVCVAMCAAQGVAQRAAQAADHSAQDATVEITIVRKTAGASRPLRIVSQTAAVDGKSASVVFEPTDGIFAVDVDLGKTHFERLTFVVNNVKSWEGVTFYPAEKGPAGANPPETVELKDAPGVSIKDRRGNCVIEFGPAAIEIFKRGGKFQFINAYRT